MSEPASPASDRPESASLSRRGTAAPKPPPTRFWQVVKQLGPGLIIAGSIVGSGELIATTKTGAQAGIDLLWLIIIGCLIKVFVQIELGRYTISHGEPTLTALNHVPGPRLRVNWIVWYWALMTASTIGQLGGIVGGVGQALALTLPVRGDYQELVRVPSEGEFRRFLDLERHYRDAPPAEHETLQQRRQRLGFEKLKERIERGGDRAAQILQKLRAGEPLVDAEGVSLINPPTYDDKLWAALVAVFTAGLLVLGRFRLLQNVSLVFVVTFTFITIGNVCALQTTDAFRITWDEFLRGLSFGIPEAINGKSALATALATFGIIGVGASELVAYPYWCLEKGYAAFAGPRSEDPSWAERARGWMRVMHFDAFASMIVYTVATVAFYLIGVAVLHRYGMDPEGMRMVSTLAEAYVPVFGEYAKWLFLTGAIAVLYSTFLVANAANARMVTDGIEVFGLLDPQNDRSHWISIKVFSAVFPLLCLLVYCTVARPVLLILIAGSMQAFMLPILGLSSLYFRYRLTDPRLKPSPLWDVCLIISVIGLVVAGGYGLYTRYEELAALFEN